MFYVYIMLDQRVKGIWKYNDIIFEHKPFYVGIGTDYRMTAHFTPTNLKRKSIKNNIIKSILLELNDYPLYYKIFENLTQEEAIKIESNFINVFGKIKDRTGILSNLTDGGDGISGYKHTEYYKNSLKKKVYQYNLNGKFIKEWDSLKSVVKFYKLSGGGGIRASIKKGFHCKNFLWSYNKVEHLPKHKNKNRPKYYYSIYKNNELIKDFKNDNEMFSFFKKKISKGNISMCCNKKIKRYLGYEWKKTKI